MKRGPIKILEIFESQLERMLDLKKKLILIGANQLTSYEYKKLDVIQKWLELKIILFKSLKGPERISIS